MPTMSWLQSCGRSAVATEVKLPRLGQSMESGTIVKWLKSEGEPVRKGEPLYELDTDKVTQEVEAEATGVLLRIAVPAGEVEVGRTVGFIGAAGEEVPQSEARSAEVRAPAEPESLSVAPREEAPPAAASNGRMKASPLAR